MPAEADQAVEGEGGSDGGAAEEQEVGGDAVDGLLAPAALLAAFPGVVRLRLGPGTLPSRENRHRDQHTQEQNGAGKQPVKRYVGHSHLGSLA
ncbi:hypothetical protein SFR_0956 [Streptomyces sp. FR-008]|nr:hypothetical protein SFR_0956 [Streptomyces sp. FR-008]